MKYLGSVTDNKDIVTKKYVDDKVFQAGGGLTKQEIVDFIYPVGSLFISTTSTKPSAYLGGTWERWGQGRVPISVSDTDSDFNTANKTGGEKTHTLLTDEMPSHLHAKGTLATSSAGAHEHSVSGTAASAGNHSHTISGSTASAGSGNAHNNMPPYITCYMWKRTA